jgi:hypothetical protein
MPPNRRSFLKMAGGIWLIPKARRIIREGGLGRVVFCRASRNTIGWLPFVLDGAAPVCEPIERDELVLCGTKATLVVNRTGWRRYA